eukprot:6617764-Alexandrium_andersonii.AAC.1
MAHDLGAIPGDQWSDVVFNLLQMRVMKNVRLRMDGAILNPKIALPAHGKLPLDLPTVIAVLGASFIDDVAVPLSGATVA